jgi:hypothetical protein
MHRPNFDTATRESPLKIRRVVEHDRDSNMKRMLQLLTAFPFVVDIPREKRSVRTDWYKMPVCKMLLDCTCGTRFEQVQWWFEKVCPEFLSKEEYQDFCTTINNARKDEHQITFPEYATYVRILPGEPPLTALEIGRALSEILHILD